MGRNAKYDWEELLIEYLASEYVTKTDFAKAKGINPSLLRRNTVNWPNKGVCKPGPKAHIKEKVTKKNNSNVTQKQGNTINEKCVTEKSNDTKKVTEKVTKGKTKKTSKETKTLIKNYLDKPKEQLTEKQLLFCFYFAHSLNATQAYIKAFECSYESARRSASLLLTKPDIRAEIQRLKEIKYQSIMLNIEDLVEKNMRIFTAAVTDFVEFGRVDIPVMGPFGPIMIKQKVINGATGKEEEKPFPLLKTINDVRFKESSEVDGSIIKSIKNGRDGASIELLDPQKAMEWLERYFMWNPMDRHKVAFDNAKLKLEGEKVNIEREAANKGQVTPEQGVKIVDDING
jgi:phage terminase small subunit